MNQFYEQELPDISQTTRDDIPGKSNTVEKRHRHLKRDKKEKAKEKLWESIIKETEGEDDCDSSDSSEEEI